MENRFKTIIVGAGPGGLAAGMFLDEAIILERKKEIGKPVQCAEGLSKRFLDEMNIAPDKRWISATIDLTQIVLPNEKKINIYFPGQNYIIDRVGFEKSLAEKSRAKILMEKRVVDVGKEDGFFRVKTDDGEIFTSKYLIGADGPLSIVRKKIFGEKIRVLPVIQYLVRLEKGIDTSRYLIYFNRGWLGTGYAWIFPKSENTANIGLGSIENKDLNGLLRYFLEKEIKKNYGHYQLLQNKSGIGPWVEGLIKMVRDNAVLVGDAAGLVDPISGGGIGNAMVSGKLAAQGILSEDLSSYQKEIERHLPNELFSAQKILYSLSDEALNEAGDILEKKNGNIFYLKSLPGLLSFLSKPHLRRNFLKFIKLFFIYRKWKSANI